MDTFSWKPIVGTINITDSALNRDVEFENGIVQTQQVSVNTKKVWEFYVGGMNDTFSDLRTFFANHAPGKIRFYWIEPSVTNVTHTVFFNDNDFKPEVNYSYNFETGTYTYLGFKVKISLRKDYDV